MELIKSLWDNVKKDVLSLADCHLKVDWIMVYLRENYYTDEETWDLQWSFFCWVLSIACPRRILKYIPICITSVFPM